MRIFVGIPVYNALESFKEMIKSLKRNSDLDYSLAICNDCSNRETSEFINSVKAKRVVTHRRRQWFTRSANDLLIMGYLSKADYIFLLNSDIGLSPGWMQSMINKFDNKTALVGSLYQNKKAMSIAVAYPHFVTGHCWCIKADKVREMGILNEDLFHIESDREYCHRIIRRGYKCILDRSTPVSHKGGASWGMRVGDLNKVNLGLLSKKRKIDLLDDKVMREKYKRLFQL